MSTYALIVKHKTRPGKRDEVRRVWETHMAPAVSGNAGHHAYYYCFDDADVDGICAFQVYADANASREFLRSQSYADYLRAVEPLLVGPPQVTTLTPVWTKRE
jgi:quinol monooxygenase YgiN